MSGWIGVDLDGTLAQYTSWDGGKIGAPIPAMVARVKRWLSEGRDVRIFTARVSGDPAEWGEQARAIMDWAHRHIGRRLPVCCCKDYAMVELWDDRAVQVIPNTGQRADGNE